MQTICPKTKAQIFMEKNKKFKTMSQFASTFFSFSYFTNSHKLLLKKQKTKNKKLTKVNPGFLIIVVTKLHMDCRTQYLQRQQESTNTRDDTKFFFTYNLQVESFKCGSQIFYI